MKDFLDIIQIRNDSDYQRDNFDKFLEKKHFSYTIPSIHVCGTNGKGSTCNYIASILTQAGYKVGLFTSPNLFSINEMIKINNFEISDEDIKNILFENKKMIEKCSLSTFEIETFLALSYFQKENCDIAVIECGMGGFIDATNVFDPLLAILTSVSLEHTSFLGRTIFEITQNKLGILRENSSLLIPELPLEAMDAVKESIINLKIKLYQTSLPHNKILKQDGLHFDYSIYKNIHLTSFADYEVKDAILAIDAIDIIKNRYPVNQDDVLKGLEMVTMSCRYEILSKDPLIIVDGAHNPEAMEELCSTLLSKEEIFPIHTIFACFYDKNLMGLLSEIGKASSTLYLTTFPHIRARKQEDYFLFADEYPFIENPIEAINKIINDYPNETILVTGSLAFASFIDESFKQGMINVFKK